MCHNIVMKYGSNEILMLGDDTYLILETTISNLRIVFYYCDGDDVMSHVYNEYDSTVSNYDVLIKAYNVALEIGLVNR